MDAIQQLVLITTNLVLSLINPSYTPINLL